MPSVVYDPMSEQMLTALPHLRQMADDAFGIEGQEVVEENPYLVFGVVLRTHLEAVLDAAPSAQREEELRRIFAFLEEFVTDPYWASGGYSYSANIVDLEILERLMSAGNEERLSRMRPYLGSTLETSLCEMEDWWERERQRSAVAATQAAPTLPLQASRKSKQKRSKRR